MDNLINDHIQSQCPLLIFQEFSPRLKGPLYYKRLHKKSNEFQITNETPQKLIEKNWRIQMRPLMMPDLMGKSQIQTTTKKCINVLKYHKSQSCDEKIYGSYGSKWRRLISQGLFQVKQLRHKKILYRFKIFVRAVQFVIAFYKFKKTRTQQIKNSKRILKSRVSIVKPRKQSGQSTLISLPQFQLNDALQMLHQLHNKSKSEIHSPLSQLYRQKQKTLSQINFDNFLKRPIQQFIKNKNLFSSSEHKSAQASKRTCKTEYSQKRIASMQSFHRKLQMSQAYQIQH
ncbi:unnamed protein product [Paramecium primaurelia]|uniref:Uncharacterized protein n=1 Tax=Paramecium primaurelia TaxID=5886 RepID=A0A8S1KLG3_PARPR|nr:unnamed protein product [Paramecium primaurelia]